MESLSLQEQNRLEALAQNDETEKVPPGWYHDGVKWVDFDGAVSLPHPCFVGKCEAFLSRENEKIEVENEKRKRTRDATPATRIVADETIIVSVEE
jgi:hypothetical protein